MACVAFAFFTLHQPDGQISVGLVGRERRVRLAQNGAAGLIRTLVHRWAYLAVGFSSQRVISIRAFSRNGSVGMAFETTRTRFAESRSSGPVRICITRGRQSGWILALGTWCTRLTIFSAFVSCESTGRAPGHSSACA